MGDSHNAALDSPYLYPRHLSLIHSENRRTTQRPPSVGQSLAPFSFRHPSHLYATQPQHPREPVLLLLHPLHPLLQLARIDELHPSVSIAPFPAVIVSPHYQSPSTERDTARPVAKKPSSKTTQARRNLDGNNESAHGVQSSAPPMTSNGFSTMANKRDDGGAGPHPPAQRPSLVSQHSNSVPSTPLQAARQYEGRSRSPSPNGGLGSHSPRSVSSEANSTMPALRPRNGTGCRYEHSAQFGRRRIPYHSSDILEKAKEEPKKSLDPKEEEKLSGDMRELYDRLQPSHENTVTRDKFVKKLHTILDTEFPGNEFKVHVFGSSGNMLYTSESDVDVCIQTPMKQLEEMHMLAEALDKHGMDKVVCVPQAKVPIVKIWDPELQLACDMNVNNTLALENTRMIKTYIQVDERVRPLAMIIKYWTKRRILNDAAFGGTISSYTWICMILNFLQTRKPPILPALHNLPYRAVDSSTGKPSTSEFADDLEKLRGFGEPNKESLGQLLFHFFRRYGHEVDFEQDIISVRAGRLIKRESKNWHVTSQKKEARNRLCVEEPFNTERNLGNSADEFAWRGIHLEIRRAFDFLTDGQQLEKACEQFEFPSEERSTANFQKPRSTKTVLAPSIPSGRGGRGGRGRGGYQKNSNGRRASSSAPYGPSQHRAPFLHSPPISGMSGQEYFPSQLHDQLFQQYQMLEMQSNSLRAQLAAQQRAQQAHQVQAAHMHAHVVAQAQAQANNRGGNSSNASPQKSPYVNGRSSPRLADLGLQANAVPPQGFLYPYPTYLESAQANAAMSQDGSRTNPSSPSLTNSIPGLRRHPHRTSNASETGSLRSHSQPPRGVPPQAVPPGYVPVPQPYDPTTFAGYPIARSTEASNNPQSTTTETPYSPSRNHPEPVGPSDRGTPKEYVGYYVTEQPQTQPRSLQDYAVPQIPTYDEITQRRRRVSSEITQPLLNTAMRRVSRSPSPLGGHMRSYSTGVNPPIAPGTQQRKDRIDSMRPPDDGGPVIVNGSFPAQPSEPRSRSGTVESLPPTEPTTGSGLGIFANIQEPYRVSTDQRQQQILQDMQRQKAPEPKMAPIANGSIQQSPVDTNGLTRVSSGGKQPFPDLRDGWINYESMNGTRNHHAEDISPTHTQPSQWRHAPYSNGLTTLDTMNASRPPPQEIKSATLPLLSPVFETRTPSPTASRQTEASKGLNGIKTQSKDHGQQPNRASHASSQPAGAKENNGRPALKNNTHSNDKGKSNTGSNHGGSWQQQHNRKKKNKKGNKGSDQKTQGEPLPANAAERKGG